jgi:hypothetical protein
MERKKPEVENLMALSLSGIVMIFLLSNPSDDVFQLSPYQKSTMFAYSFSAKLGITPIRSNTLSLLLLFVIVLLIIGYTVLFMNISTVYFVSAPMSNFPACFVL